MNKDKRKQFCILCTDGSIIDANVNNLYDLLAEFKVFGNIDRINGSDRKWNDEYLDMSLYPGETYAYITDNFELVISDFKPFSKLLDSLGSSSNMISTAEYGELNGKSQEQIKVLCRAGRIIGARKVGANWMIPEDAPYSARESRRRQSVK